jgi:hypothetical protein
LTAAHNSPPVIPVKAGRKRVKLATAMFIKEQGNHATA